MAKQTINIGTSANDGTGDPLRSAMDKTNDNFTELYNGAGGVADGAVTTAKLAADAVDSDKIADGAIDSVHIADDQITYAKLADEFTTIDALTAAATVDIDFADAQVYTLTITEATALTFSNVSTGMVKDIIVTGDFALTLPTSLKEISGTYDGTVSNLIQVVSTNGATEQWGSISQEAV